MKIKKRTLKVPKTLIVQRKKWLRGEGDSYLKREKDGKMCCLGFACLAAGLKPKEILGIESPATVCENLEDSVIQSLVLSKNPTENTTLCYKMMCTNDSLNIDDVDREANLTKLFKRMGTKVIFKG